MAERLLLAGLSNALSPHEASYFKVASAGLMDVGSRPMEPSAARALEQRGISAKGHVSRKLIESDVQEADLVLGMTREHRGSAISLVPRASRCTFTLLEFARLCADVDPANLPTHPLPQRARAIVTAARLRRGLRRPPDPSDDDVPDPIGKAAELFTTTAQRLNEALVAFLELMIQRPGTPAWTSVDQESR